MVFHAWNIDVAPNLLQDPDMATQAQVSATISTTTKELLDQFTEQLGLKKNFVVEQALLYFMAARRELPDEAFISTRITLSDEGFERLTEHLEEDSTPSTQLVELMNG